MNTRMVVVLAGALLVGCSSSNTTTAPTVVPITVTQRATNVIADGKVLPVRDVTLSFTQSGTLAKILVAEGDTVTVGQPLVQLDTRALVLRLDQAKVGLARANAKYDQIAAGAPPESIAVAKAGLSKAQAASALVQTGVLKSDIEAAKSQLADAKAALAAVRNPKATDRDMVEAALNQATATLKQQHAALSAAKTAAKLTMDQAVQALNQTQITYASTKENWQYVTDNQRDPFSHARLNDSQQQQYYDAMIKAESAMHSAELQLQTTQVAYDNAQQAESSGVSIAESRVSDAQARLDQLQYPDESRLAAAQAKVSLAESNLARLQGGARTAQLDTAAADVAQAEAQYAQIAAPARAVDLAAAKVEIDAATIAVAQSQYDLDQATLTAPFAGVVATMDLTVGQLMNPALPAIVIADMQVWHVETEDLTELQVVNVHVGDAVAVSFDALPDLVLPGTVRSINQFGSNRQGDIVYTAIVDLAKSDPRLRWNMTATITVGK
jgi:multidrug resistance efflux pump